MHEIAALCGRCLLLRRLLCALLVSIDGVRLIGENDLLILRLGVALVAHGVNALVLRCHLHSNY